MQPLVRRVVAAALDTLCPERCAACDAVVASAALFCHACRATVNVLGPPECDACGCPLPRPGACARCASEIAAPVRRARAVVRYDTGAVAHPVARAVQAFKYSGRWRLASRMAAAMVPRVATVESPVVVPVPLHPTRLRARGYNQSAMLAAHFADALDWPVDLRALARTRDTSTQTALSAAARRANVEGAFAVMKSRAVRDRHVVLVDDVWTSGATAHAAARALRDAGARAVDVLTFARVADPRYDPVQ